MKKILSTTFLSRPAKLSRRQSIVDDEVYIPPKKLKSLVQTDAEITDNRLNDRFGHSLDTPQSILLLRTHTLTDHSQEVFMPTQVDTESDTDKYSTPELQMEKSFSVQSSQFEKSAPSSYRSQALANAEIAMKLGRLYESKIPSTPYSNPSYQSPYRPRGFASTEPYSCSQFDNTKPSMEDVVAHGDIHSPLTTGHYFLVCDGHGIRNAGSGTSPGAIMATFFANDIPEKFQSYLNSTDGNIEISLLRAFKASDIESKKVFPAESTPSGSTAIFVFMPHYPETYTSTRFIHVANCGDSRAIITNGKQADQLTLDHDLMDLKPSELERIEESGLQMKNGRIFSAKFGGLNMCRTLGNWAHTGDKITHKGHRGAVSGTPDIFTVPVLKSDEKLIIACDGVYDVLKGDEIAELISYTESPEHCSKLIMDEAIRKGSTDNISVIVVSLNR